MLAARRCLLVAFILLVLEVGCFAEESAAAAAAATTERSRSPAETYLEEGDAFLMQDSYEEAIAAYEKGMAVLTGMDPLVIALSLQTNLATAQYTSERLDDAAASYQAALFAYEFAMSNQSLNEEDDSTAVAASAAFYLGMVYQDRNEAHDAIEAYHLAHSFDPLHWSALANLGSVYQDLLLQYDEALEFYNRAYLLLANTNDVVPTDAPTEPRFILSQLQYRIGVCVQHFIDSSRSCAIEDDADKPVDCKELAAHAFSLALEFDSDNEAARHMLATITADATMKRASNTYVKSLFDDYAKNFEHSLVHELGYTGYERLRHAFDQAFGGRPPMFDTVVDAGCGTGLAGEQFRNVSNHLLGVDLSQAIIDQAVAKRPDLYDETMVGDLLDVFRERFPVSLIIAADSYIYFGDLEPLFVAMRAGLGEGSYAAFTLEGVRDEDDKLLATSAPDWRWQLTASGRFAHRKQYLDSLSKKHDMRVVHYQRLVDFRYERGVGVQGHVYILKKVAANDEL